MAQVSRGDGGGGSLGGADAVSLFVVEVCEDFHEVGFEAALERVRRKKSGSFIGLLGLAIIALQDGFFQFLISHVGSVVLV